jgi:hypothetical protein
MKQKLPNFLPQVRFNWGFHDATKDAHDGNVRRDMATHPDYFYAAGYNVGFDAYQGKQERPQSSEPYWLEWVCATPGARERTRYEEGKTEGQSYIDEATEKQAHDEHRKI